MIKIDIQCLVEGDIVLECVHLDLDPEREVMMFRIMFNTAFIRSNILILNCDDVDMLWDSKYRYPKNFRAEVLFAQSYEWDYIERNVSATHIIFPQHFYSRFSLVKLRACPLLEHQLQY